MTSLALRARGCHPHRPTHPGPHRRRRAPDERRPADTTPGCEPPRLRCQPACRPRGGLPLGPFFPACSVPFWRSSLGFTTQYQVQKLFGQKHHATERAIIVPTIFSLHSFYILLTQALHSS